jgi:hypothetical protein
MQSSALHNSQRQRSGLPKFKATGVIELLLLLRGSYLQQSAIQLANWSAEHSLIWLLYKTPTTPQASAVPRTT